MHSLYKYCTHISVRLGSNVKRCKESQQRQPEIEERKKERKSIYIAPFYILCISQSAQAWITQFYLQIHHACLSFVSVHQIAPPLTHIEDTQLQLTTHLSTPKG